MPYVVTSPELDPAEPAERVLSDWRDPPEGFG